MNPFLPGCYYIKHGSIPAVMYISRDPNPDLNNQIGKFIFMSDDRVELLLDGDPSRYKSEHAYEKFNLCPEEIKGYVNDQFSQVFALPIDKRKAWVADSHNNIKSFEVKEPA